MSEDQRKEEIEFGVVLRRCRSGQRRKIQFVVVAQRFQCAESFYPEILSTEEGLPDMLLGHRPLVLDFFYDDEPEVIEAMVRAPEMLVYRDRFLPFRVVPVFVYPSIGLL